MRTLTASTSAPDADRPAETTAPAGRIGPNAAIQLIAALRARGEDEVLERLFREAGREAWLTNPPEAMIPAEDAARLHVGLRRMAPRREAEEALVEAGRLTAEYLLANRIPRLAQTVLKWLPGRLSAKMLMGAISAHAWTFAGDGRFEAEVGREAEARIYDNPLCEGLQTDAPACVWHAAVLETLFKALVAKATRVTETQCRARGDACCRFRLRWSATESAASIARARPKTLRT